MYKLSKLFNKYPAYGNGRDIIRLLENASELNYEPALQALIKKLVYGHGSTNKAITLAQKAAKSGSTWAMNQLGSIYIKKDTKKAIEWYEKSASMGDTIAMIHLGDIYNEDPNHRNTDRAI